MKKELICVVCPRGCRIQTEMEEGKILSVTGNSCPRGEAYARQEMICPLRILTSTVRIEGASRRVLPVITASEIPLAKMPEAMAEVRQVRVQAPVQAGQVLKENLAGTGTALLASCSMEKVR